MNTDSSNEEYTRLYLVRHGELVTSQEWRFVGQMDVPLNKSGKHQIAYLARRLSGEKIETIFSSDLKRTMDSAKIINRVLQKTISPIRDFREIALGIWEGLTLEEIISKFPAAFRERTKDIANYRVKDGESFIDLSKRVIPKIKECVSNNSGKRILLVAHGGVNRIILADALGLDINKINNFEQNYACLNIIDYYKTGPVVKLLNEGLTD